MKVWIFQFIISQLPVSKSTTAVLLFQSNEIIALRIRCYFWYNAPKWKNLLMPKHSFTNSAFTHSSAQPLLSTKHKDARCNCAAHTHPYKCSTSIYNCNVYLWHDQNTQFFFAIKRFSRFNQKQLRLKKNFIKSENINVIFTFIFWQ